MTYDNPENMLSYIANMQARISTDCKNNIDMLESSDWNDSALRKVGLIVVETHLQSIYRKLKLVEDVWNILLRNNRADLEKLLCCVIREDEDCV